MQNSIPEYLPKPIEALAAGEISAEIALQFKNINQKFPINCGDGRVAVSASTELTSPDHSAENDSANIRIFGADAGIIVMLYLYLKEQDGSLIPQQFHNLYDQIPKRRPIGAHTDQHNPKDFEGCKALGKLMVNTDVADLLELLKSDNSFALTTLVGEHNESGLILPRGSLGFNTSTKKNEIEAFCLTIDQTKIAVEELIKDWNILEGAPKIDLKAFGKYYAQFQLQVAHALIFTPNLPIIEVTRLQSGELKSNKLTQEQATSLINKAFDYPNQN